MTGVRIAPHNRGIDLALVLSTLSRRGEPIDDTLTVERAAAKVHALLAGELARARQLGLPLVAAAEPDDDEDEDDDSEDLADVIMRSFAATPADARQLAFAFPL